MRIHDAVQYFYWLVGRRVCDLAMGLRRVFFFRFIVNHADHGDTHIFRFLSTPLRLVVAPLLPSAVACPRECKAPEKQQNGKRDKRKPFPCPSPADTKKEDAWVERAAVPHPRCISSASTFLSSSLSLCSLCSLYSLYSLCSRSDASLYVSSPAGTGTSLPTS